MVVNDCWNVDATIGVVVGPEIAEIMKVWVYNVCLHTPIQEILPTEIKLCITFMSLDLYMLNSIFFSYLMKDSAHTRPDN